MRKRQASSPLARQDSSSRTTSHAEPVEAGLVRHGHSWPGLRRAWPAPPRVVKKPTKFFRAEDNGGTWPDEAVLELSRPPGYDHLSDDELAALIDDAIEQREQRFRNQYDAQGRPFLDSVARYAADAETTRDWAGISICPSALN